MRTVHALAGNQYIAGGGVVSVGRYAAPKGQPFQWRPGAVPCPYCHRPMVQAATDRHVQVTRCVRDPDARRVYLGQDLPVGCLVHRCGACVQVFVTPPQGGK